MTILTGTVTSGRGRAAQHISNSFDELVSITGRHVFPGTLNVILDRKIRFSFQHAVAFDQGRRFVWSALIQDHPVWIYRWKGAPLHIVEVISECKLRDALGLKDKGKICIEIDSGIVDDLNVRDRLSSLVIWGLGRRRLYYNNRYTSSKFVSLMRRYTKDGQR